MLTLDALRRFGADVDDGLGRCMNNEKFYLRLVGMALVDENFTLLPSALAAHDLEAGFRAAHALKGVMANLALAPMFKLSSEITELLRAGDDNCQAQLEELLHLREELAALQE